MRAFGVVIVVFAAVFVVVDAGGAAAASCRGSGTRPPNVRSAYRSLHGVAATSACDAWAVGSSFGGIGFGGVALIEHSNGRSWKVMRSPNPAGVPKLGGVAELYGVAATSPRDAWAVGSYNTPPITGSLIEHWNGKAWKLMPTNPHDQALYGVAATSSTNAWAVGVRLVRDGAALILHWNGKTWKRQPNPNGRVDGSELWGVAATSSRDAWAVGCCEGSHATRALIEHWNGQAWKLMPSPTPGGASPDIVLRAVAATSSGDAWAAGDYLPGGTNGDLTLIEHWNGKAWKVQPSPNGVQPSPNGNYLWGVAATSSRNAWAVGYYETYHLHVLIEHWNGKAWRLQNVGVPAGSNQLYGVAATSPRNAWAVGYHAGAVAERPLIERWNGAAWNS